MHIDINHIAAPIAIGIGATALMDVWNTLLRRVFRIPSLNYCMLGRWLRHMPRAFRHSGIGSAPRKAGECTVGWLAHYSIGISLTTVFLQMTSGEWLSHPTLLPALLFGIVTVVFPFFVMQPAFGLGLASSRAPRPWQARLKSMATHTVFGLGLYGSAMGADLLL